MALLLVHRRIDKHIGVQRQDDPSNRQLSSAQHLCELQMGPGPSSICMQWALRTTLQVAIMLILNEYCSV